MPEETLPDCEKEGAVNINIDNIINAFLDTRITKEEQVQKVIEYLQEQGVHVFAPHH